MREGASIMVWVFAVATVVVYGGVMKYVVHHVDNA